MRSKHWWIIRTAHAQYSGVRYGNRNNYTSWSNSWCESSSCWIKLLRLDLVPSDLFLSSLARVWLSRRRHQPLSSPSDGTTPSVTSMVTQVVPISSPVPTLLTSSSPLSSTSLNSDVAMTLVALDQPNQPADFSFPRRNSEKRTLSTDQSGSRS